MRAAGAPALLLLVVLAGCSSSPRSPSLRSTIRVVPPPAPAPAPKRTDWVARKVVPGAVVTPQGRFHIVKQGETGIAIARAYGVPWREVVALNRLSEPYVIRVGQRLRLPGPGTAPAPPAAPPTAASLEERARAFALNIDDVVTGGQPAAPRPARPAPATVEEPPTPLPAVTGSAPAFRWPLPGRIISGFGPKAGGRFNDGVNLKASAGEPVRAAGDGVVAYAGDAIPGFGNLLLVKHAGGWVSAYGHNEALLVARGARVKAGEVIARAGQTGAVAEPQLHFELRRGRAPVDPAKVIGGR
ncbi:peptidoglycan DD-metalloendopeptidase family protein [Sandarakinorhabdus sp.]|uniref:peptidoglycan DD-metalloendopeptidase family protein n=1 Tax=Sandarakinorhabdus sp. TaxID=1916663 RepID=UPI003F6FC3E0